MKKTCLLILLCVFAFVLTAGSTFAAKKNKPVEIEVPSYDGFKVKAMLDIPEYATIEYKVPLVIFLHSIQKSHTEWGNLPDKVRKSLDVAVLNVDLRGHGNSIYDKNNKKVHWQNLEPANFRKMPEDILEIFKFLETEYPEVNTKQTAIIGASLGATVGMMAASYDTKDRVKTVIMLSPMIKYKGFDLRLPIVDYGQKPLLLLVSQKDKYPYESSKELIKFAQGKKLLQEYPFGGHGEDLLIFQPESTPLIMKWLEDGLDRKQAEIEIEKRKRESKFKYREVGEYSGKVKIRGDIHWSLY